MKGRVHTTSSACTSASQGLGYAYEAIRYGHQKVMIAGGAEALCPSEAVVFDTLFATSTRNDEPQLTPRPFDKNRDGLVIGEGLAPLFWKSWIMLWNVARTFMPNWSVLVRILMVPM